MNKPKIPSVGQMRHELFVKSGKVLPPSERDANLAQFLKDSAIKDRLYHGTNNDFRKFSDKRLGQNTDSNASSEGYAQTARVGHWFNTKPMGQSPEKYGAGYKIDMPVYLSIKNPKREMSLDWLAQGLESKKGRAYRQELEKQGYDGVVLPDEEFGGESWVAFRPKQIKSATGNRGTYDLNDPDINKAGGGPVLPIGPPADIAAKLAALKEQMRQQGTNFDRRMQGIANAEKTSGSGTVLPTDKARGGVTRMAGGGHKELEEYIRQHEGQYGLHRLQRAQDEIHNLHGMYAPEALRQAFSGDNAKALMTMNPADFEKYAMQLKGNQTTGAITPSLEDRIKGQKARKTDLSTEDYVKYLQSIGKFSDVPYLQIDKEEVGLPLTPFISGHEGRHRNRAMASQGINRGLVVLHPRTELREPLPRRSREEYINALKEELAMTGNMVKPQQDKTNPRPAIQMPDIYAHGGSVTHAHHLDIEERPL